MNLQQIYELRRAAERVGAELEAIPRGKPRTSYRRAKAKRK